MSANLQFDTSGYTPEALRLILAKAQEWSCTPAEAVARLLDQAGKRFAKTAA